MIIKKILFEIQVNNEEDAKTAEKGIQSTLNQLITSIGFKGDVMTNCFPTTEGWVARGEIKPDIPLKELNDCWEKLEKKP